MAYNVMERHSSQGQAVPKPPAGQQESLACGTKAGPRSPALTVSLVLVVRPPFLPLTIHVAENQEFRG